MPEWLELAWTKTTNFIDQYPISLVIVGVVFILIGVIINTKQERENNFNIWVLLGCVSLVVGLFKITGMSFMSF